MRRGSRRIDVGPPHLEHASGGTCVTALVDGVPLWFETADSSLTPAPEAFASALLLASQHRARTLVLESPVSSAWLENVARLLPIWKEWWGYEPRMPEAQLRIDAQPTASSSALLFSGGVDSFYSLLTDARRPDYLVSVHGFDIPIGDAQRMAALGETTRAVAAAYRCGSIVVRTNLREHPSFGRPHLWERAHGGALAAVGHLLGQVAGRLVISSSFAQRNQVPWGSSFRTDPLFASDRITIDQFGGAARREDKIAAIAFDPLVQRHLRVCWENRSPTGNCSRCEKCVMTRLHFAELGVLENFKVLEGEQELDKHVASVPFLHQHLDVAERMLERGRLARRLSSALGPLVSRSRLAARVVAYRSRLRYLMDSYA